MAIRTTIDTRGVTQETRSGGGTTVEPNSNNFGFLPHGLATGFADANDISAWFQANAKSGTFTIDGPGYVLISGSTLTTGTMPPPNQYPGGMMSLVVGNTLAASTALITGSSPAFGGAFLRNDMGIGMTGSQGNKLKLGPGGTCLLWSDGYYWYPIAGYGTFTIAT